MSEQSSDLRALDLRLARALGLKIYELEPGWWYYIPGNKPRRTHAIDQRPVPHYSTDGTAMLALIDGLTRRGYLVETISAVDKHLCRIWRGSDLVALQHTDVLTEAVTLAALAALEGA